MIKMVERGLKKYIPLVLFIITDQISKATVTNINGIGIRKSMEAFKQKGR